MPSSAALPTAQRLSRVLIVDDHPVVRQGLARVLDREPDLELCGEADSLAQALEQVEQQQPDLIITDLSLRESNGMELIKELAARHPDVKVIVSSIHDESVYAERALRAGASAYIGKGEPVSRLLEGIRDVLEGRMYLSPALRERLLNRATSSSDAAVSTVQGLSDRELQVFEMLGRGQTTREIAEALGLKQKTVETYREKIKEKLGLENGSQLICHAVQWVMRET